MAAHRGILSVKSEKFKVQDKQHHHDSNLRHGKIASYNSGHCQLGPLRKFHLPPTWAVRQKCRERLSGVSISSQGRTEKKNPRVELTSAASVATAKGIHRNRGSVEDFPARLVILNEPSFRVERGQVQASLALKPIARLLGYFLAASIPSLLVDRGRWSVEMQVHEQLGAFRDPVAQHLGVDQGLAQLGLDRARQTNCFLAYAVEIRYFGPKDLIQGRIVIAGEMSSKGAA